MQEPVENNKKLMDAVGKVVKNLRCSQRKSIYKISAEVMMSKSTWREVEIGACKDIKLTTLWKVAEGLDMPFEKLIIEIKKELGSSFSLIDLK